MAYPFSFFGSPGGARAVRQAAWHPHGRRWLCGPRSALCAAVVVAAASACKGTAPEVQDPAIVTDGKSFQLTRSGHSSYDGYDAKVPHTFTNRTGANVYIDEGCSGGHFAIDVYEGGRMGARQSW